MMILEGVTVQECLTVYNELNMVAIINDGEFLGFIEEEIRKVCYQTVDTMKITNITEV